MKRQKIVLKLLMVYLIIFSPMSLMAQEIQVAVASNFKSTMSKIVLAFEQKTQHKVVLIFGASGKHYAQIKNGAPYDAFFSADAIRPQYLEDEGLALAGSRFTYALGQLVLWSKIPNFVDAKGQVLHKGGFHHLAIASPKLAPYGRAAYQVLKIKKLWQQLKQQIVRGENIGQTFQFVNSENAKLGFVAYSQIKSLKSSNTGSRWLVPPSYYSAIKQQAVLLKNKKAARELLQFVQTEPIKRMIEKSGYQVP